MQKLRAGVYTRRKREGRKKRKGRERNRAIASPIFNHPSSSG